MFTGIIRHVGAVRDMRKTGQAARLTIDLGPLAEGLACGDSVSVSGACLTLAGLSGSAAEFDVAAETLDRTTLGGLRAGSKVNLELPLQLGGRLHGHLVQGHIDGVAEVRAVRGSAELAEARGGQVVVEFAAPARLTDQMVPKGSAAIDGVSLTLVDVADGRFSVALIPTTLAETTFAKLAPGERVNVETDLIGKYVRKAVERDSAGGLTLRKLREAGFA